MCGTAAEKRETLVVPDVMNFPGHIACDASSRSEIVVPILAGGEVSYTSSFSSSFRFVLNWFCYDLGLRRWETKSNC